MEALREKSNLEEIGLYHVLQRIASGRGPVDEFLRYGLHQRGLVAGTEALQLTDAGKAELLRLAGKFATASESDT